MDENFPYSPYHAWREGGRKGEREREREKREGEDPGNEVGSGKGSSTHYPCSLLNNASIYSKCSSSVIVTGQCSSLISKCRYCSPLARLESSESRECACFLLALLSYLAEIWDHSLFSYSSSGSNTKENKVSARAPLANVPLKRQSDREI